jgi:hypothetical protein
MSYQQGKLFPQAEKLKLRQARVKRLQKSYWDRLWRKGWDPAYILEVEPDDIPTLAEVWRKRKQIDILPGSTACPETTVPVDGFSVDRLKAVVLSKGPEDQNRRIVAIDDGGWITGLFIALLQRQVLEGTEAAQGGCYATLINLELYEGWEFVVDRWTKDLLTKRKI